MSERPVQTTLDGRPLKCDTCGKPLYEFEALYSLAYKEEAATGRHWDCHTPLDVALRELRSKVKQAEETFNDLKGKLR